MTKQENICIKAAPVAISPTYFNPTFSPETGSLDIDIGRESALNQWPETWKYEFYNTITDKL